MSINLFEQGGQFSSILSLEKKRDTHHIDETTSLIQKSPARD
ncbi:hypothetical protein SGF_04527 [Shigella flexneri CDC 796-83]|uniref:Uncharacterized protein n=1 Tax=Shigella flexneri CDC 796-83 TaxID=945360 RepID=A0A6N3QFF4_SHIFL|nr:hypothetical protein SGF_04527 [Shigella flexneri CDC 796-83]